MQRAGSALPPLESFLRRDMPIIVKEPESRYKPAPAGLHQACCVDVEPQWTEERPQEFGGGLVEKTRIAWVIAEQMEDGRPYTASKKYTLSLHEKSNLCKDLTSWRGREFTAEEKQGFDLEKLIGVNCQVQVVHVAKNDRVYANVTSVVPLAKGMTKMDVPKDYVRKQDRQPQRDAHDQANEDDGVPF